MIGRGSGGRPRGRPRRHVAGLEAGGEAVAQGGLADAVGADAGELEGGSVGHQVDSTGSVRRCACAKRGGASQRAARAASRTSSAGSSWRLGDGERRDELEDRAVRAPPASASTPRASSRAPSRFAVSGRSSSTPQSSPRPRTAATRGSAPASRGAAADRPAPSRRARPGDPPAPGRRAPPARRRTPAGWRGRWRCGGLRRRRPGGQHLRAADHGADRQAAAERLAAAEEVGPHALVVDGEQVPGAAEAGEDLVGDQERAVLPADVGDVGEPAAAAEMTPSRPTTGSTTTAATCARGQAVAERPGRSRRAAGGRGGGGGPERRAEGVAGGGGEGAEGDAVVGRARRPGCRRGRWRGRRS